ncbi:UvrD-helicase domain-containing protein [Salinibacterium sp. ZJ77]|uniref:ATP-dependent helicase n=1 Tax=Salinibacterium sp. ZJ77 TaxID=2708337 RepID=UPI0014211A7D|nr:UvrD-helicase domain-containing protein [Salinibacterium sp. ZJ77]
MTFLLDGFDTDPGGAAPASLAPEDPLLAGLNPQQREAVMYRGKALLIVAGAGSGKTSVLTRRIAGLLSTREAWPSQILAITFTNKAAAEMRERVHQLVGGAADGMWISTFHSACVRILRRQAEVMGLKQAFTIYDSSDSKALLKRIIKELEVDTLGLTVPSVAGKISKLKNELTDADTYARGVNPNDPAEVAFIEVFRRYTHGLRRANALDFDDLIAETVHLFRAFPDVAALYQRRFRHVLVDEYQDTNHAQYALIRELTRGIEPQHVPADTRTRTDATGGIPGASLTVVGDSDQSIYAFRGADIRNIVEFERDFPDAKVILLEQNYRSTQNILDAANAVISINFDRQEKNLFTTAGAGAKITGFTGYSAYDEAQFVADEIQKLHEQGESYKDMAVFVRVNSQTRALEDILIRSAIPYRIAGGTKFYERAEIKDVMGYLIQVANPADDLALRRIMNTPKRGIGPATEAALQAHADRIGTPLRETLREADKLGLGPKVTKAIMDLGKILDDVEAMVETKPPADVLTELLVRTGYVDALRATRDAQDEVRAENVEELLSFTKEFAKRNPEGRLIDFLTEVALVAAADDIDDESGAVTIMTLHTAKGLEYDTVFLTGIEEDLLPHRMSAGEPGGIAEERRLFYVGITRARKRLYLSLAMTRAQFGDTSVALPSRFLQDIPGHLIEWRQSPGMANSRGGTQSRALNGGRSSRPSFNYRDSLPPAPNREKREWKSAVTNTVRDNGDLTLEAGDRIRHTDFGDGKVVNVTGEAPKAIAEVQFETAGRKRLLIKIAPIEKL